MVLIGIALWVLFSFIAAPVVGALIAAGNGDENKRSEAIMKLSYPALQGAIAVAIA